MNGAVDRELVERLIRDGHSYREAARIAQCSDWSARRIGREMAGDDRPMKSARRSRDGDDTLGLGGWAILAGIGAAFLGIAWLAMRWSPGDGS